MGILGGTGEAREFVARNELLQLVADVLPAGGKRFAGAAEESVGEFAGAEAGEAAEDLLFVWGGVAFFLFDFERQAHAGEIVGGAGFPAACETAIAGKMEVPRGIAGVEGLTRVDSSSADSGGDDGV